jgi:ABC-type transporter Mla subunit MlaD
VIGPALRWTGALAREVSRLPSTMAQARRLLVDLPDALADLTEALEGTNRRLDQLLPELSGVVGGMDEQLRHLDATLTNALGAIPGVRRALGRGPRSPGR